MLASSLNDIHSEYENQGKIVQTTTDKGSNVIQAFEFLFEYANNEVKSDGNPVHTSYPGEMKRLMRVMKSWSLLFV